MSWDCYCPEAIAKSITDAHDFTTPGSQGPYCPACGRHRDNAVSYNAAMRMLGLANPGPDRTLLGLEPLDVEAGAEVHMVSMPQRALRLLSILVDYATADAFELLGMRIGDCEHLAVGAAAVPLSMMGVEVEGWPRARELGGREEAGRDLWDAAVVRQCEQLTLVLRNTSSRAVRFRGVMRVEVLQLREPHLFGQN